MVSLENITANNGWAIAAVGGFIVFMGLVFLSCVISRIHKIFTFFEKKASKKQ